MDAALLLEIMAGRDEFDATSSSTKVATFSVDRSKKYNIAYSKEAMESEGLEPSVKEAYLDLIKNLENDGHNVVEISFPFLEQMVTGYYVTTTAEASSNLSRYSGMLYGQRSNQAEDIESTFKKSRNEGFGKEVKRRIMTGTFVLSADFYEAYYSKAQRVRRLIQQESNKILENFDFFLCPTAPSTAFDIDGEKSKDPIQMYLADIFTVQASLAGLPAISVPTSAHKGLPIGMHLMGRSFEENDLLNVANTILTYNDKA